MRRRTEEAVAPLVHVPACKKSKGQWTLVNATWARTEFEQNTSNTENATGGLKAAISPCPPFLKACEYVMQAVATCGHPS
jgi:hypothetical protein